MLLGCVYMDFLHYLLEKQYYKHWKKWNNFPLSSKLNMMIAELISLSSEF